MKKRQKNSTGASALQITLAVALILISAILLASSFKAAPAANGLSAATAPGAQGNKDLAIAGRASVSSLSPVDVPFTFSNTGSLNTARYEHTATLLPNGKVLVAGGLMVTTALLAARNCTTRPAGPGLPRAASTPHATVTRRRCCPTARCWWQGDMATAATLTSAELYDPASGTWTATGSLNTARYVHTATLLPNGKVLVAGGDNDSGYA